MEIIVKVNILGFLCAIHCIATPFLFIAKACTATCCSEAPTWWIFIDYIFLIISFTAIYYTNKSTTMYWIKLSLWISWFLLGFSIVSHSFDITYLPKNFIYLPAIYLSKEMISSLLRLSSPHLHRYYNFTDYLKIPIIYLLIEK